MQPPPDLDLNRRIWKVQRWGAWLLLLLTAAAALGAFGTGPLSAASRATADGRLTLRYERLARAGGPTELTVELKGQKPQARSAHLWLSTEYLDSVRIEAISPEPRRVVAGPDRTLFHFGKAPGTESFTVTFHVQPRKPWRRPGRVGSSLASLAFRQFVYP